MIWSRHAHGFTRYRCACGWHSPWDRDDVRGLAKAQRHRSTHRSVFYLTGPLRLHPDDRLAELA